MLRFLTAGESHGPWLTAIVEGMPAGLTIDEERINHDLRRRQGGYGRGGRMQIERDRIEIHAGCIHSQTTGAPLALRIKNKDWENWKEREWPPFRVPRPGHADLPGMLKYGLDDARPILERASARETAARVAVGGLAKLLLDVVDITVGSYVVEIGGVEAQIETEAYWRDLVERAEASDVRCPDPKAAEQMRRRIDAAREAGDSLGGVFTVVADGLPVGLGSHAHWERRLDARLAYAVMGIQAIKGVEIGPAFENAGRPGTKVHDELLPAPEEKRPVRRATNRAGGIEGGMSNGEPVVVRAAMKPIPTTVHPLRSIDLETGEPTTTQYERSDVCAVPAASVVGEAMVAWTLAQALLEKTGGDSITEIQAHLEATS